MTLFYAAGGEVRVCGVRRATNEILHSWLKEQLGAILESLPEREAVLDPEENLAEWKSWQEGLSVKITLLKELPPLRMILVWDNLIEHLNAESFFCGCSRGGSWYFTLC